MTREPMWRRYLRFWGPDVAADVDEELAFHIETRADAYVRAGLSPDAARARARAEFGDLAWARAECRAIGEGRLRRRRWAEGIGGLRQGLRRTLRSLGRSPGYAATVVATLALAIGVNVSLFTLLYALALRPLPVPDATRVVSVFQELRGEYSRRVHGSPYMLSLPEYEDYARGARSFEGLAAVAPVALALGGAQAAPVSGRLVSCNYFRVLRVRVALGRALAPDECARAAEGAVAVVSHAFWRARLGGDPAAVGSTLALNRHVVTVVGVADSGFTGTELEPADLWIPVTMQPLLTPEGSYLAERDMSWLNVLGRLKPGATLERARAELAAVARRADADDPGRETVVEVDRGAYLNGPAARREGAVLAVGVLVLGGFIVLMACLNVMSLLLARAAARQRETGIRLSLGAGRARLVVHMLGESAVLAAAGGAGGIALAWWLPALLLRAAPEGAPPLDLRPGPAVVAYGALLAGVTAIAFGLVPALQATRLDPAAALRQSRAPAAGRALARTRGVVVGAQLAGSLLLLVFAALFLRGVARVRGADLGFETGRVLALSVDVARAGYTAPRAAAFHDALRERVAALPGVESVALAGSLPLVARHTTAVLPDGGAPGEEVPVGFTVVSAGYFETMRVPIVRGRAFDEAAAAAAAAGTARPGAEHPAVVSEAMARRLWPGADPLGRRFRSGDDWFRVWGVARDGHNVSLGERDGPFFYQAASHAAPMGLELVVRTAGPPDAVAAMLPRVVATLDPQVLTRTQTMERAVAALLRPARAAALAASLLGALAAALAAVGVYGIVAYGVAQRTREVGIRLALGATRADVVADEARRAARVVLPGIAAGLALAAVAARVARSILLGVSALDPLAFLGMTAFLAAVAAAAVLGPARRAARLDPAASLRAD